jgi:mannose-6-phosphate isomerase-like protein (cupin superfamily)
LPYLPPEEANNKLVDAIKEIKARRGTPPWREKVLATPRVRMLVHCWPPNFGHAAHYHPRADEIWYVCEGKLSVSFDGGEPVVAGPGSVLFAQRGTSHDMKSVGEVPLVMLCLVAPNEVDDEVSLSDEKMKFPEDHKK